MGAYISIEKKNPSWLPYPEEKPTFDPQFGFSMPRKERVMKVTQEQMTAAQVPLEKQDYCAHLYIDYLSCRRYYWPFPVMCKPEKHSYLNCEYDDYVLRMKEYEREKRLRLRQERIEGKKG